MILLIKNAKAGKTRTKISSSFLAKELSNHGHNFIETNSLEHLESSSKEIARSSPRLIALWGGDGTITKTLTSLYHAYQNNSLPPICLLPGGTMNIISRSIGIKGSAKQVFDRLIKAQNPLALPSVKRTLLQSEKQLGFLCGVGLMANFIDAYLTKNRPGQRGALSTLLQSIKEVFSQGKLLEKLFMPFRGRLLIDGQTLPEQSWVNISVGSVKGLGLGFNPYTRASEQVGAFHWIAHNLSPTQTLLELPRIRLGKGMKHVTQGVAKHMIVEMDQPMRFAIDGELLPARNRFEVSVEQTLQLVTP